MLCKSFLSLRNDSALYNDLYIIQQFSTLKHPAFFQSDISPSAVVMAIPGLHIVANLGTNKALDQFSEFREFIDTCIVDLSLTKVGEVYHNFDGGGYTGVVCLTESHLSIHTWPEKKYLTFDVFLSNHLRDNRSITRELYRRVLVFFDAQVLLEQIIER